MRYKVNVILFIALLLILFNPASAANLKKGNLHYTDVGFFDIHVCNWPNRPLFFMVLFSTYDYPNVKSIEIVSPDKKTIQNMSFDQYRVVKEKNKAEKRVFINQVDIPENSPNGQYDAIVTMNDGSQHTASDYVIIDSFPMVTDITPKDNAENVVIPKRLQWRAAEDTAFYQIFVKDLWNDGKIIFTSTLTNQNFVDLPDNLLEADSWYSWVVHARDSNEHVLLGDFNHGSLSPEYKFTTKP